jgi:hypothetical protein
VAARGRIQIFGNTYFRRIDWKNKFASVGPIREKGAIEEGESLPGTHFFILKFRKFLFP